jgi:hypothetical protein
MPRNKLVSSFVSAAVLIFGVAITCSDSADAQTAKKKAQAVEEKAPPVPASALLRSDAWKGAPTSPLQSSEIDQLLHKAMEGTKVKLSAVTSDEQFLRRVRLDLTGQLPTAAEVKLFHDDKNPNKRAEWIDKLIDSDEYARHWARYWRHTVASVDAPFGTPHVPAFEDWLFKQFKQDKNWGDIVRALVTAEGSLKKDEKDQNGAIFFLGRFNAVDGNMERTAETSRLFLGLQLQCAQCHNDRRTKLWKQVQFHEMAGFFARMQVGGSSGSLIKLIAKKSGEHKMPTKESPKGGITTLPRFLDGKAPAANMDDLQRRKALADYLTATDNYWFSAAYVNRMWSELMGQGFYDRVDDLSPKGPVVFPEVLNRLAASFSSDYDTKKLLRALVNTQAYQRQVRLGESLNQHMQFAAVYPSRLRGDVIWKNLDCTLGRLPDSDKVIKAFRAEFDFDPSLKTDEVQETMSQALWLLNNPVVNDRVKVQDLSVPLPRKSPKGASPGMGKAEPTLLKKLLTTYTSDDPAALRELYVHTLARRPTDQEVETCLVYIQRTRQDQGTRNDAFEDIFRALLNTAEFQRRR